MRNRIVRIPEDVYHNVACGLNGYSENEIDKVFLELILIGIEDKDFHVKTKHKYLKEILDKYGKTKNGH